MDYMRFWIVYKMATLDSTIYLIIIIIQLDNQNASIAIACYEYQRSYDNATSLILTGTSEIIRNIPK